MAENTKATQPAPPPPPAPPVALSEELRAAIKDAVRESLYELRDESLGAEVDDDSDTRAKRTIRHSMFSYELPGGGEALALRGQTVDLLPHDVERGERLEAFTENVGDDTRGEFPAGSSLPPFAADASDQEKTAWVEAGSVQEVLDAVAADPSIADDVLAAEQRRKGDARKTLLEGVAVIAKRSE